MTFEQVKQWWDGGHADRTVSLSSVAKYAQHYRTSGQYFVPSSGGAQTLLTEEETNHLLAVFDGRRVKGTRFDYSLFARAARGICRRSRPHRVTH